MHALRPTPVRLVMLAAIVGLIVLAGGCNKPKTNARSIQYVDPDRGRELMDASSRGNLLSGPRRGVWVDPRTTSVFEQEHIPGAINLPFQHIAQDHRTLNAYGLIIVYGEGYNDAKAEAMSKRLIELGHENVYTLRGGLKAWRDAGMETAGAPQDE